MATETCILKCFTEGNSNVRVFAESVSLPNGGKGLKLTCPNCKGYHATFFSPTGPQCKTSASCVHTTRAHSILSGGPVMGAIKLYPEILAFAFNDQAKKNIQEAANAPAAPKAKPGAFAPPATEPVKPPAPAPVKVAESSEGMKFGNLLIDITEGEIALAAKVHKASKPMPAPLIVPPPASKPAFKPVEIDPAMRAAKLTGLALDITPEEIEAAAKAHAASKPKPPEPAPVKPTPPPVYKPVKKPTRFDLIEME